jgi:hypothetical protein
MVLMIRELLARDVQPTSFLRVNLDSGDVDKPKISAYSPQFIITGATP